MRSLPWLTAGLVRVVVALLLTLGTVKESVHEAYVRSTETTQDDDELTREAEEVLAVASAREPVVPNYSDARVAIPSRRAPSAGTPTAVPALPPLAESLCARLRC